MSADKVRSRVPVGLGVDEQHGLANIGRHRPIAGERADPAIKHHMGRRERAHDLQDIGDAVGRTCVLHEVAGGVSGNVVVLLADIVGLVVADGAAIAVLEAVSWQHHNGPIHAGNNMVGNHRSTRGAMIDESARLIDPDAIEVRTIRLNGRVGSIQKWRTDLKRKIDFDGVNPVELTTLDIEQVQREHVIDWLTANHDGHAKQFLRARDGTVYGIDKGQAFKHLGEDRLSIDYHPNGGFGEKEPFYNTLFRAVKGGDVEVDPAVTLRTIREVEKIPDEDYLAILRPYAEGRFGRNEAQRRAFYDTALERKRNLRLDFEAYYADMLGKKDFRFDDVVETLAQGKLGPAEQELLEEVRDLGWQGKAMRFDEGDIEDQNELVFAETFGGRQRTVVKMKVRPEAEEKLLTVLRQAGIETTPAKVGQPIPEDVFANDILAAVKTVNHHTNDAQYNQTTLGKLADHMAALKRLRQAGDRDIKEMAGTYIAWIEKVQKAARDKTPIEEHFETYLKKRRTRKKKRKDVPFTVRRTKVLHTKRQLKGGDLVVVEEAADNKALFQGASLKAGEQYEIDFGDGVRAVYRPSSDKNLFAQRGELELMLPDRPDAKSLNRALEQMDSLGLKTGAATPQDAELLYLHKQAYLSKVDREPEYQQLIQGLDRRAAGKEERIQTMRGFWERRLGVKDLTRMAGYEPLGTHQSLELTCSSPACGAVNPVTLHIDELETTPYGKEREFSFELPGSGRSVRFGYLDGHKEKRLAALKEPSISSALLIRLVDIDGAAPSKKLMNEMTLGDRSALRQEMVRVDAGIDTTVEAHCESCNAPLRTRLEAEPGFLFPGVRL